ncbi:MAG: copper resistance protein NlpE [Weeksellaceae bacterium]|nr:copper resistance protein NlpE [Weeksellaceae bacterium]
MKTSVNLFSLAVTGMLLFSACNEPTQRNVQTTEPATTTNVDMHTSKISVDWAGKYFGVLPCASCPGINTTITLGEDGTYVKTVEYLESDDTPETTQGNFTWDDEGRTISIDENRYLVGENQLKALDMQNNVIEGELAENYVLTKVNYSDPEFQMEGVHHNTFVDESQKEYKVVFNTNPAIPTALLMVDGKEYMLSQSSAWAKGGEYAGDGWHMHVQGDEAKLKGAGKEVKMQRKQ